MLAVNELTCGLLSTPNVVSIGEYARRESARSFERYIAETNRQPGYLHAHAKVEYDGHILRCVPTEAGNTQPAAAHVRELEAFYAKVDQFSPGSPADSLSEALQSGVLWWYDIDHLAGRYSEIKETVLQLAVHGSARLAHVPVVIGGDWQFNAWACPAGHLGDFVMVNLGIIHLSCYAAMFLEIVNGSDEQRDSSPVSIIASSMLWQAAIVFGCKSMQWGNLALPSTQHDRIWRAVQHPTEHMRKTKIMIDAFTMLHELGHIACGHTDVLRQWMQEPTPAGDAAIQRRRQMRAMEHEADDFACRSIKAPIGRELFDALYIVFSALRLCEHAPTSRSSLISTHPDAKARLRRCIEALGSDGKSAVELLDKFVSHVFGEAMKRVEMQERDGGLQEVIEQRANKIMESDR